MKKIALIIILAGGVLLQSCYYDNKEELYQYVQEQENCTATAAAFTADIAPILLAYCNRCHNNTRMDGNVNLEGYSNVKPYADDGSLYGSTNHDSPYAIMPPSGSKIPFCDIEKMRLWIEAGAQNN